METLIMRDYIVECDYCEESDIGLIDRTVVVTVRANDKFDAIHKAKEVVPCTVVWRLRKKDVD